MTPEKNMRWVESAGGPLVLVPCSDVLRWLGAHAGDYDEACSVDDYAGKLQRVWGEVVVLGDEPMRSTFVHPAGEIRIIRWRYAPGEALALQVAETVALDSGAAVERLPVVVKNEPYLLFDSARSGREADGITVRLEAAFHVLATYLVNQGDVGLVVHRFE